MTARAQAAPRSGRREPLRSLKRLARLGLAPDAPDELRQQSQRTALALLERSMRFGHRRLAVRRLLDAIEMGAPIAPNQWIYCEDAASVLGDSALKTRLQQKKQQTLGTAARLILR